MTAYKAFISENVQTESNKNENAVIVAESALAEFVKSVNSYVLERGMDIFFETGEE